MPKAFLHTETINFGGTPKVLKPNIKKPLNQNDNYVSCTTIDIDGSIKSMSKHFPKMDFLKKLDLYPRDLRKIDNSSIDIVPTIAVRKNCILVNLLHIKSIIMKDRIMIFDTSDASSIRKIGLFIYDLQDKLKTNINQNTSFEFKALETILINVMSVLENDLNRHISICSSILFELENQIDRSKLRDLLIHSKALTTYTQKALLIRNVLDELLETDEDLKGMYLTQLFDTSNKSSKIQQLDDVDNGIEFNTEDSEFNFSEIEILLENYYNQCDEFVQQANSLISDIKSTEEIVNIILDSNRNSLMLYDLKITIYTLGFTVATTLPAFYGMNLKNFIEDSNVGFGLIVGASILSAVGITVINFKKLRSVQRLTMMLGNDRSVDRFIRDDLMNKTDHSSGVYDPFVSMTTASTNASSKALVAKSGSGSGNGNGIGSSAGTVAQYLKRKAGFISPYQQQQQQYQPYQEQHDDQKQQQQQQQQSDPAIKKERLPIGYLVCGSG